MQDGGWAQLVFPGDGEMVRRMRGYQWGESALGDPRDWPASLRTACRICLTSRFPMIIWWGPDLRFLYNDAYMPLLGDKHPALDRPGQQVWSEIWDTIGPMLDSVMSTGRATWSEDQLLPMRRHAYWEETYWTYSYSPLHDDDGTVRGVFTAVAETTEQVVGRRRLAVLQDLGTLAGRGRSVAEICDLVVGTLARFGQVVPYAAVYLRGGDVADEGAVLAASSAPGAGSDWPVGQVLRSGRPVTLDRVAERFGRLPSHGWPDPPTEAMVLPLQGDAGGAPVGVMVLAASAGRALDTAYRDFLGLVARQTAALVNGAIAYHAQLRRAEELAELDRAKTTFFSNISHEFRTPLTLIAGPLEELRKKVDPADAGARADLDVIARNSLRLGKLVNSLLDFSRIEAGRLRASYEPVDLSTLTVELASMFRSAVERAGLRFEVDCPTLSAPVDVDREMWEKIVFNLLSNALKFTLDGRIAVTLGEKDGQAVLRVSDTGSGIPQSELPWLFDRFYRVQNARARSNEGSGIGLALVRELVGLHQGTISVQSTEGEGTTFTVSLPFGHRAEDGVPKQAAVRGMLGEASSVLLSADPYVQEAMRWLPPGDDGPAGAAEPAALAVGTADADAPLVLLADDNADMRDYLQRLLRPGYQVTTVTDGQEALDAARGRPPDLVISDVMMPRLDGLELVAALRADPRTADVPVLLLSARAGQEAAIEGLDAGADDYLVKPFSAAELLARVRTSVQLSRMRGQHARWDSALAALGPVLARAASMADTLREALGEVHRLWRARRVIAAIWTDQSEPTVTASIPDVSWQALPGPLRATLARLRDRPPLVPDAEAGGAGITLEHPDGILTVWLDLAPGRTLSLEDETLLSLIFGRVGQALHRAHLIDQQRDTALALQRAILGPAHPPPGFSVRYEPATRPLEVGGDWHDLIALPDGRIAIVVGDCVGHDLGAATVMGQLRSACRALLLQETGPGQVLTAMDRFADSVPGAEYTTVFCAVLDPLTGRLVYSAAGHPPALVALPDGGIVLLEGGRSVPLAAAPHPQRREAEYLLPPRSTLLLYTDGLVERRGRSLTDGIDEAGAAVASGSEDTLEDLATHLMAHLAPPRGYGDDVAVVLYRHPAQLELTFPADTGQLRPVRVRLRHWLDGCGLATALAQDALVAAGEAVANAIEHGHRDRPGAEVRLTATVTANQLRLTIADSGSWLPPGPEPTPYRGKGVMLMHALMDNVSIDTAATGTTVTMDVRISDDHAA
jgi:signal transduction histidine kinase/DNA-binding response OmpR family regulator/anti-sigma regulatory factor (Ser/Thr protein kinase)